MSAIANMYVNLIRNKKRTVEQVPIRYRAEVEELLKNEDDN